MYLGVAKTQDINQLKELWTTNFDDGTSGFCDFAFTLCPIEQIYIIKNDEEIVSMLMAIDVYIENKKGFYLYSACTKDKYRNQGNMEKLITFAYDDMKNNGYNFCILQPANKKLFEYYKKLGFTNATKLRKCKVEIKKNLWAVAEFDIVTASRLATLREKYKDETMVHFTTKGYEKVAEYIYTFGGASAETENGYCIYYQEGESILVREMFAKTTADAVLILQAIKEKTGVNFAGVYLNENSDLFLGDGNIEEHCLIKGEIQQLYANLMLD